MISNMMNSKIGRRRISLFNILNFSLLGIIAFCCLFPFYNVMVVSFTGFSEYMDNPLLLFPKTVHFDAYVYVFQKTNLLIGLKNSIFIALIGVCYNMFLSVTLGYGLSRRYFAGRNVCLSLIVITMFFSGGLIPFYIIVANVFHLNNSIWAIILPSGINTFYLLIIKNYFSQIPPELEESAKIDGAHDFQILYRIILPISKPVLATFALFYAVDRWNEWFNAMLFLQDRSLFTLQLVLREIVVNLSSMQQQAMGSSARPIFNMAVKCAALVITTAPIMVVYPFLQKYFAEGMLLGAVKS
jgi:putative aldouronate transport system permease protein